MVMAGTGPSSAHAPWRRPVRLMIVDDSLVARTALGRMVGSSGDLEVVAGASTAESALDVLRRCTVDVILLDLDMPGMGGLAALPEIIARANGARILVVSSFTVDGAEQTLAALSLGAADTLPKPDVRSSREAYRQTLLAKIRELGSVDAEIAPKPRSTHAMRPILRKRPGILAIGASTGGIHALTCLFEAMPRRLGIPILVTQHLPSTFMPAFARQLASASGYETVLAQEGMPLSPDRIVVAPGDAHLTVQSQSGQLSVRLDRSRSESGCMPSVDWMFGSLAKEVGDDACGVVLTGMGRDGVSGAASLVAAGGTIIAQDEASSAVWGMPRAIVEAGLASAILPPVAIARHIADSVGVAPCR